MASDYNDSWVQICEKIDAKNVDLKLFATSDKLIAFKNYLFDKTLLFETKRIPITDFNVENIQFTDEYKKYSLVAFHNDNTRQGIRELLITLKEHIIRNNGEYLHQFELPFGKKEEEASKIVAFLRDNNILKFGGLNLTDLKYGDNSSNIKGKVESLINDNEQYKKNKEFILSKFAGLQGEIRSKKKLKAYLKTFMELDDQDTFPAELGFFAELGLDKFIVFEEVKSWWDWRAFAVAMIGLLQIVGGAVLISLGFANFGQALISEGINDMVYATMAGLTGTFSWKDWGIQKAISIGISILTAGASALASLCKAAKTTAAIGSISKTAIFCKCIAKSVVQFATTALGNLIGDRVIEAVVEELVRKVVNFINDQVIQPVKEKVFEFFQNAYKGLKVEEFIIKYKKVKEEILKALKKDVIIDERIENIRNQIGSCLNNIKSVADNLVKSSNVFAKVAGYAVKAGILVNTIWDLFKQGVKVYQFIKTVIGLIEKYVTNTENSDVAHNEPNRIQILKERVDDFIESLKEQVIAKLTEMITRMIKSLISTLIQKASEIALNVTKAIVDKKVEINNPFKEFKGKAKNSIETIKDFPNKLKEGATKEVEKRIEKVQNKIENAKNYVKKVDDVVGNFDKECNQKLDKLKRISNFNEQKDEFVKMKKHVKSDFTQIANKDYEKALKQVGKSVFETGARSLISVLSSDEIERITEQVLRYISNYIQENFIKNLKDKFMAVIQDLYMKSRVENFDRLYKEKKEQFKNALEQAGSVKRNIEDICAQINSTFDVFKQFKKEFTHSKLKVTMMKKSVEKLKNLIESLNGLLTKVIETVNIIKSIISLIEKIFYIDIDEVLEVKQIEHPMRMELIISKIDELNQMLVEKLIQKLKVEISKIVRRSIEGAVKQLNKAIDSGMFD